MKFLLPHITHRKTTYQNLSDVSDAEEQFSEESFSESLAVAKEEASTSQASTCQALASGSQVRKRKQIPQERRESSIDSDFCNAIQYIKPREESNDEDELFLRSLAPKMKMLDPLSKLECQAEMQLLLLRYLRQGQTTSTGHCQTHQPHYNIIENGDEEYKPYQLTSATPICNGSSENT